MYSYNLNSPLNLKIDEIQKNEFVYFKLSTEIDPNDASNNLILDSLTQKTDRLFFSIDDLKKFPHIKEYETEYPISWFGVPVTVGSDLKGVKIEHTSYSNVDSLSLSQFDQLKTQFNDHSKVIPEFALTGNHYQLGPTIVEFFDRYQLPFAFIKIDGPPNNLQVQHFREAFESLRLKGFKGKIYFSFSNPNLDEWNIKTYNTFSGLQIVHIDLSNKCTHSCVFCGLWGPEFIDDIKARSDGGILKPEIVSFMNRQMPHKRAIEILESLPDTIQSVQFGGAGDPLTHPNWLDILSRWRSRGLKVEVLTNFEYPTHSELDDLHTLSKGRHEFDFMVNVSAATPEVYKIIRPRQSHATFEKVIANIRYSNNLRVRDGFGVTFTMIHIINSLNFMEAVKMVELAHELGAGVWLKPLEVHSDIHKKYSISKEDYPIFKKMMKEALQKADELKVRLVLREFLEAIAEDFQND